MTYSLNEVSAMAKKAARGAGFSWGMAEDAAMATRWLCARGLRGCDALAGRLSISDLDGACSVHIGCKIMDLQQCPDDCVMSGVAWPILLLPFVAQTLNGGSVTLRWGNAEATTDGRNLSASGSDLICEGPFDVSLVRGEICHSGHTATRAHPSPDSWAVLESLAHRTYAPATEESRLSGAGAGLSDND